MVNDAARYIKSKTESRAARAQSQFVEERISYLATKDILGAHSQELLMLKKRQCQAVLVLQVDPLMLLHGSLSQRPSCVGSMTHTIYPEAKPVSSETATMLFFTNREKIGSAVK